MKRLKELYTTKIIPKLVKEFNLTNINTAPKIQKISINVGVGKSKEHPEILARVSNDLYRITGQLPRLTKSKKAISGFKLRTGDIAGINMTLRGNAMYDFLEKLLNVGLPRVRDFRGLSMDSFDKNFNYTYAVKEHIIFPEITYERIEDIYGFQISFHIKSNKKEEAIALLKQLGFPFKK
jgi:large subunit ribosomal protein L5